LEISELAGYNFAGVFVGDQRPDGGEKPEAHLGQRGRPSRAGSDGGFDIETPVPPLGAAAFLAKNLAQDPHTQATAAEFGIDENVASEHHAERGQHQGAGAADHAITLMGREQMHGIDALRRRDHDSPQHRGLTRSSGLKLRW